MRLTNDQNSSLSTRFILTLSRLRRLRLSTAGLTRCRLRLFFNRPQHGRFAHFQHPNRVGHPAAVNGHLQNPLFAPLLRCLVGVVQLKGCSAGFAKTTRRPRLAFAHFRHPFRFPAMPTFHNCRYLMPFFHTNLHQTHFETTIAFFYHEAV